MCLQGKNHRKQAHEMLDKLIDIMKNTESDRKSIEFIGKPRLLEMTVNLYYGEADNRIAVCHAQEVETECDCCSEPCVVRQVLTI